MKLTHKMRTAIVLLTVVMFGVAVYFANQAFSTDSIDEDVSSSCDFIDNVCRFEDGSLSGYAEFISPLQTAEKVDVRIFLASDEQVNDAWVEGVNMYMGKTPVRVESHKEDRWSGWFMLGACMEPKMKWQMVVNIKDRPEPVLMHFVTTK